MAQSLGYTTPDLGVVGLSPKLGGGYYLKRKSLKTKQNGGYIAKEICCVTDGHVSVLDPIFLSLDICTGHTYMGTRSD